MDYLIYNLGDPHLSPLADATLLSEEERRTAKRRGSRYLLTRCLLRRELARRLKAEPQDLCFRIGERGKPVCEGSPIHFNISHSGDCFAMAFDASPIGIDVERERPRRHMEALAARLMCPEQLAAFRSRGCPQEEFYNCWCAAEAIVKQAGGSIWQAKDTPFQYEHGRIQLPQGSALSVRLFIPMPGYRGAIAGLNPTSPNI